MDSSCETGSQTLESMLVCETKAQQQEKKARPADAQSQKCPRCDSSNTKFCYYNNYSLSQPRYFCKSCRRYWTKGGTLRNVPVGGGCRRPNKRSSSASSCKRSQDHPTPGLILPSSLQPNPLYDSNDLSIWGNCNSNAPHHHQYHGDHFLGSLGLGAFLDNQPSVQNLNYVNNNNLLEMANVGIGGGQEREIPHEGRVLWGFPWIGGGGGDAGLADMDSGGRPLSWNGIGSSNWQGLLNSPLM